MDNEKQVCSQTRGETPRAWDIRVIDKLSGLAVDADWSAYLQQRSKSKQLYAEFFLWIDDRYGPNRASYRRLRCQGRTESHAAVIRTEELEQLARRPYAILPRIKITDIG